MTTEIKTQEQAEQWLNTMMDNVFDLERECATAEFEAFPQKNLAAKIIGEASGKLWRLGHRLFSGTVKGEDFESKFREIDDETTKKIIEAGYDDTNEFVKKLKAALTIEL